MPNQIYRKKIYPSGKVRYIPTNYIPPDALSNGVWLVQNEPGYKHRLNLSYLFDLPPTPNQVAFSMRIDDIARAINKSWKEYVKKGSQSPLEVAEIIVKELGKKE